MNQNSIINSKGISCDLRNRYLFICEQIENAAINSGRKFSDIHLVAVTKKVDAQTIKEAAFLGMDHFGENYFQEAKDKIHSVGGSHQWSFIGSLQKNKAKGVVELFNLIQSVDSVELAEVIDRRCASSLKRIEVLLQIHYGDEETKGGFLPEDIIPSMEKIENLKNIDVVGLMTIPPLENEPEENRKYFRNLLCLSETVDSNNFKNWNRKYISMGMTDDYKIAISEGSNMVRIGRAIFGERT